MNEEGMKKLEKAFLKKLYRYRDGAIAVSEISENFYGISDTVVQDLVEDLVGQGFCAVEELKNYRKRDKFLFITALGLMEIEAGERTGSWQNENLTYEKKCHGYNSIAEYLQNEQEKLEFQQSIMGFLVRTLAYVETANAEYVEAENRKEYLEEGMDFIKKRCAKEKEIVPDMRVHLVKAAMKKLVKDREKECFKQEVEVTRQMIEEFLNKEREREIEYEI